MGVAKRKASEKKERGVGREKERVLLPLSPLPSPFSPSHFFALPPLSERLEQATVQFSIKFLLFFSPPASTHFYTEITSKGK